MVVKAKKVTKVKPVATGYCFSCRVERQMNDDAYVERLLTGRKVLRGTCSKCGKSMGKMVSADTPVDRYQTEKEAEATKVRKAEKAKAKLPVLNKLKEKAREEGRKKRILRLKVKEKEEEKATKRGKSKK